MNAAVASFQHRGSDDSESLSRFQDQIEKVSSALEQGLTRRDLGEFYRVLRSTELPFVAGAYDKDTHSLFHHCFNLVHRLGSISPAAALAVENHMFVTAAIATVPVDVDPELERRRRLLLESIVSRRLLVANTNSYQHGSSLGGIGARARREAQGFRINGKASYVSLSTQADLLLFVAVVENDGPAIFVAEPMQANPGLTIGNFLFPTAMVDSDTRQLGFRNLFIPPEGLLIGAKPDAVGMVMGFEMVWHQLLMPALYLGAAARAIEEVRKFLRVTTRDNRPLAELDGMIVDVGRMAIEYESACCVIFQGAQALAEVRHLSHNKALERALKLAAAAKYVATRSAESLVTAARRIIGGRSFTSGHPLERLSQEVMFAVIGPEVNASIERDFGQQVLKDRSFMDWGS